MRLFYLLLLYLFSTLTLFGQRDHTYIPSHKNFEITYEQYNHKNKKEFTEILQLIQRKRSNGSLRYNIQSEITKPNYDTYYQCFHVFANDSLFYIGGERYMNPIQINAYQKMVVKLNSDKVIIPIKPKAGQMLPEASCEASIMRGIGDVLMTIHVMLINRRVVAKNTIETPSGKFKCYKIKSDKLIYSGISRKRYLLIEWYAINTGLVRSELRNRKGKLINYKVITKRSKEFILP
jgi:hypothetical protein